LGGIDQTHMGKSLGEIPGNQWWLPAGTASKKKYDDENWNGHSDKPKQQQRNTTRYAATIFVIDG